MARKISRHRARQAGAKASLDMINFLLSSAWNIIFYALMIFIIYRACIFAYDFCYQVFGDAVVDKENGVNVEIVIPEGTSTMELASKLEMNRLVKNRYSFYIKIKLLGYNILAGKYHLNTSMTYDEIISTITNYKNAIEEPEGETS